MVSNEKWDVMVIEIGCMKLECCFGCCCVGEWGVVIVVEILIICLLWFMMFLWISLY